MSDSLSIAFFASSLVSAYWNGAATYYRGIVRCLHRLGHRVTFYEPDAFDRQRHRDIPDPPWAKVVVYRPDKDGVSRALEDARMADVLVKASGVGVWDELLESAVLEIKRPDATAIFWDVDAPATLDRVRRQPDDPFRALIPRYDLVLTYGGGQPVADAYAALGARRCEPIYNALDPDVHHPVEPADRFRADLSFLGNRMPDRDARVNEFFFSPASALPDRTLMLGGNGWDDRQVPPNVKLAGHVYTADHNAFNVSASAVLNVSRQSMALYGFSPATRIFEAAGAGACIITDHWDGIGLFLEPDREILVARDGTEVVAHLRDLSPERARAIGGAALQRVRAEHTYRHRARTISRLLMVRPRKPSGAAR